MSEDIDLKEILEAQKRIMHVLARMEEEYAQPTLGEKIADMVVKIIGSWRFIIIQAVILVLYIIVNTIFILYPHFDPYPFILLNLILSFQAAFTAPLLLIANNVNDRRDRRRSVEAYKTLVNIESMMSNLHQQIERKKNGS